MVINSDFLNVRSIQKILVRKDSKEIRHHGIARSIRWHNRKFGFLLWNISSFRLLYFNSGQWITYNHTDMRISLLYAPPAIDVRSLLRHPRNTSGVPVYNMCNVNKMLIIINTCFFFFFSIPPSPNSYSWQQNYSSTWDNSSQITHT